MTSAIRKTTIKEQGKILPLGVLVGGKLEKAFDLKDWTWEEEMAIGKFRTENSGVSVGQYVGMVLATMLTKLGNVVDFSTKSMVERRMMISNLAMADVLYVLFCLRREAIGSELVLNSACPSCKHEFKITADLSTLEVKTVDEPKAAEFHYQFARPFDFRGKKVTGCVLGPPNWSALEGANASTVHSGTAKLSIIQGSLRHFDEHGPIPFAQEELTKAKMTKIDIEGVLNTINESVVGPEMIVESKCPKCSTILKQAIEWSSESFFSPSSQSSQ